MKKYPDPSPATDVLRDASRLDTLEFPVNADFDYHPPTVELPAMLQRIEENLRWRNQRPGETERRLADKIPVEFVL